MVVVCDEDLLIVELNAFVVVVDDDDVGSAIVVGFIDVTIADFGHSCFTINYSFNCKIFK